MDRHAWRACKQEFVRTWCDNLLGKGHKAFGVGATSTDQIEQGEMQPAAPSPDEEEVESIEMRKTVNGSVISWGSLYGHFYITFAL